MLLLSLISESAATAFATTYQQRNVKISVAAKIFEDFGGVLCKAFIIGRELVSIVYYIRPVSIVLYTRPGSSIKRPTPN